MRWRLAIAVLSGLVALPPFWSRPAAQQGASVWSDPVNVGPPINTQFLEGGGALSRDGLSMYFTSNRPCRQGDTIADNDLWVARRRSPVTPWEVGCLGISLDGFFDSVPSLSPDEQWLYFVSDRPGSAGTQADRRDIWVSRRRDVRDHQGWSEPVNLGSPVNTDAAEGGPAFYVSRQSRYFRLLANPKLIFNSARTTGVFDLWEVNLFDGLPYGAPRRIDEVSTAEFVEAGASISADGLELFFQRGLPNGPTDIFTSTRTEPDAPWSPPVDLGSPVNQPASQDAIPNRSPDGTMLFFQSNRPGGMGGFDIWVTTRDLGGRSR